MTKLNIRPLSIELKEKSYNELNETDERIEKDLEIIREWLSKTSYMKSRTDDQFLIGFLRGCKFSIEKTKEKLDMFYSSRFIAPELYPKDKILDLDMVKILKKGICIPLPSTEHPISPRIVILRICDYDFHEFNMIKIYQMATMLFQIMLLEDDNFVLSGLINIIDMTGYKLNQMSQFTPKLIEKLVFVTQDSLPVRQKAFHFINLPPGVTTFLSMFKNLLSNKNQNRAQIEVHGDNIEQLLKHIPKTIMPKDYGNDCTGPSIDEITNTWVEKLKEYERYFLDDEQYGTDETKRPGGVRSIRKDQESYDDLYGTFRKLDID